MKYLLLLLLVIFPLFLMAEADFNVVSSIIIEKITHFVEWPESLDVNKEFRIACFGMPGFMSDLTKLYEDDLFYHRTLAVDYNPSKDSLYNYQIIIIDKNYEGSVKELVDLSEKYHVMTLSNRRDFVKLGVMINLYREDNRITFIVNDKQIRKSALKISYHLLKMGELYDK